MGNRQREFLESSKPPKPGTILSLWADTIVEIAEGLSDLIDGVTLVSAANAAVRVNFRSEVIGIRAGFAEQETMDPGEVDSARATATYLVLSVVPSHLLAIQQMIRSGFRYEAILMSRSFREALDLAEFFVSDRCTEGHLAKWLKGGLIPARDTRAAAVTLSFRGRDFIDRKWIEEGSPSGLVEAIRSSLYRLESRYLHHTAGAIEESILTPSPESEASLELVLDHFHDLFIRSLRVCANMGGLISSSESRHLRKAAEEARKLFFPRGKSIAPKVAAEINA